MTNKYAVQAFPAASALFLAMSDMSAWTQDASAPATSTQVPAIATAPTTPQNDTRADKSGHHGGFRAIDTNGDGQVSCDEVKGHAWLERNLDQTDTNHDGQLSKDELAAWHKAHKGEMHEKTTQRFDAKLRAADKDNDGSLTKGEVQAGMPCLVKNFDQIDVSHDDKITEDEIRVYMKARYDVRKAQKNTPTAAAIPGDSSATKGE